MTENYSMPQDEFMYLLDKAEPLNMTREILPPYLLGSYLEYERTGSCDPHTDDILKEGMELAYLRLKPYLQAALPHYEAGLRDTRIKQADGEALAELARYREIANHG